MADDDRSILLHGLETAIRIDREQSPRRSMLSSPDRTAIQTLSDAISKCAAYQAVAGQMAYTGGGGPILTADLFAGYLFSKGENRFDGAIIKP